MVSGGFREQHRAYLTLDAMVTRRFDKLAAISGRIDESPAEEVAPMMSAFSETDVSELRDQTWSEILPWLDTYESSAAASLEELVPGVEDWWIADTPRDTAADSSLDELLAALGALVVRRHRSVAFRELVPSVSDSLPLAALHLSPRAETVARRLGNRSFVKCLLERTVDDMFTVRGTSLESVEHIATGLVGAAIRAVPEAEVPQDDDQPSPAAVQLVDDLRVLARWRRLRGRADDPLIEVEIDDKSPESVQDAALRVAALTGRDLDETVDSSAIDEIDNLVEQFDDREEIVLRGYLMAQTPISLGELSTRLHVTKSRAGVLVSKVKRDFLAACDFGTAAGGLMAAMRTEIQPVTPLNRLIGMHPILDTIVPSLGVPLWLVLDRLDDAFEVTGRWAASPDVASAKLRTVSMLEQFESANGVVALSAAAQSLGLCVKDVTEWFAYSAIPMVNGFALLSTAKVADYAAGVLEASQRTMTTTMLIEALDSDRSEAVTTRALGEDGRFICGEDGHWRLDPGTMPGGSTSAGARDFRTTRHLYRIDDTWMYRVQVGADHLRGATLTIPAGAAEAFGLGPSGVLEVASDLGPQTFRWIGTNPTCGTIRRFLVELSAKPGDIVFLGYSPTRGFAVTSCPATTGDPIRQALALVGCRSPEEVNDGDIAAILAAAVGLAPDSKPRRILSAYQSRDETVADLLESAWVVNVR